MLDLALWSSRLVPSAVSDPSAFLATSSSSSTSQGELLKRANSYLQREGRTTCRYGCLDMFSEMFITCTTKGSDSIYICKYIDLGGEGRHWFYTLEVGCPLSQPFPQPAWSVIYHFLQLVKRCQFSWTVHVGWYMNMIHLTHPCIILPFVQCSCDLSPMLCGKFPVTLIVTAWEQLPTIGNS